MKLCDLIKGISDKFSNVDVLDICDNSKNVTKDSLFVSIPCARQQEFLKEAISLGAKVVITFANENDIKNIDGVLYITIANVNPRKILAELASKMYINHVEKIVAITGTNGKTSTTHIVRDIWQNMSIKAASIGTLGIITNDKQEMLPNHLTSPGSLMLHKTLNRINADRVVMEASSHGIDQYRMAGLHFNVCAFTNFSEDHLDYHKTMENYWKAKSKLFQELAASNSVFVANADDPYCQKIATIAQQRNIHMITYGRKAKDFRLIKAEQVMNGQKIYIDIYNKSYNFFIPLLGDFQVYNAVCATAICYACGDNLDQILETLPKISAIPGRLELVSIYRDAKIFVDFAHTPDGLSQAIQSLRKITNGRLITIFGCGGDRDHDKRAIMGNISEKYSDITIVTDDNPRTENPESVRKMIMTGCTNAIEIADRANAIKYGISLLHAEDALLIAGKGHETYQIIGDQTIRFSDREMVLKCVQI